MFLVVGKGCKWGGRGGIGWPYDIFPLVANVLTISKFECLHD
jgi:hypothetical protein